MDFTDRYLVRGDTRVELTFADEGYSGDYDPSDPDDKPLIRFYVQRRAYGTWQDMDDASYCTATPTTVSEATQDRMLETIMSSVEGHTNIKRICEELSWLALSDEED